MPKQDQSSAAPEPIEAKRYPCQHCGLDYKIAKDLRGHLLNIHGIRTFVCEACAEPFYEESDLAEHVEVVHRGFNRHYCPVCGRSYKSYKTLLMHSALRHKVEESVFCEKCGQQFHNSLAHRSHLQLQHKSHQVYRQCDKCTRSFRLLGYLKLHKQFDHGVNGKKKALEYLKTLALKKNVTDDAVHCKLCNVKFKYVVDLIKHLQLEHAKVKKFTCCQCSGAIYHSRASLAGHMRHDHGIINHSCSKCPPVQRYYKNVPLKVKKIKKIELSKQQKTVSRSKKESMLSWFMNQNAPNLIQKEPQVIKAPWLGQYIKENIPSDLELKHVTELELNNLRHNIKTAFNILSTVAPSKLKASVVPETISKGTTKNVLGKNVSLLSIMFPNFNPGSISTANSSEEVHIVKKPSPLKSSDRPNITESNAAISNVNIENGQSKTVEECDNTKDKVIAETVTESKNMAMDEKKSFKRKKDNKEKDVSQYDLNKLQKNTLHKQNKISKLNHYKKRKVLNESSENPDITDNSISKKNNDFEETSSEIQLSVSNTSTEIESEKTSDPTGKQQKIKSKEQNKPSVSHKRAMKGENTVISSCSENKIKLSAHGNTLPLIEKKRSTVKNRLSNNKVTSQNSTEKSDSNILNEDSLHNTKSEESLAASKQSTKSAKVEKPNEKKFETAQVKERGDTASIKKVSTSLDTDLISKRHSKELQADRNTKSKLKSTGISVKTSPFVSTKIKQTDVTEIKTKLERNERKVVDKIEERKETPKLKSKTPNIMKSDLAVVKLTSRSIDKKATSTGAKSKESLQINTNSSKLYHAEGEVDSIHIIDQESHSLVKDQNSTIPEEKFCEITAPAQEKRSEVCKRVPEASQKMSSQSNGAANVTKTDKYLTVKSLKSLVATKKQNLNIIDQEVTSQVRNDITGSVDSCSTISELLQLKKDYPVADTKMVTLTPTTEIGSNRTSLLEFETPISSLNSHNFFQEKETASHVIGLNTLKEKKSNTKTQHKLPISNSEKKGNRTSINAEIITSAPKLGKKELNDKTKLNNAQDQNNKLTKSGLINKFSPPIKKIPIRKSSTEITSSPEKNKTFPSDLSNEKNSLVVVPIPDAHQFTNYMELSAESFFSTLNLSSVRKGTPESESIQQNNENSSTAQSLLTNKQNITDDGRESSDITPKDSMLKNLSPEKAQEKIEINAKSAPGKKSSSKIKVAIKSPLRKKICNDETTDFDVKSKYKKVSDVSIPEKKQLTDSNINLQEQNNSSSGSKVVPKKSPVNNSNFGINNLSPSTMIDSSKSCGVVSKNNDSQKTYKPIIVVNAQKKVIYDLDSMKSTKVTSNSLNKFASNIGNIDQSINKNVISNKSSFQENSLKTVIPGSKEKVTYIPIKEQKINNKDYVIVVKSPNIGNENKNDHLKKATTNIGETSVQIPINVQEGKPNIVKTIPTVALTSTTNPAVKAHSPKKVIKVVFPNSQYHANPDLSTIEGQTKIHNLKNIPDTRKVDNNFCETNKKRKEKRSSNKFVTNGENKQTKKDVPVKIKVVPKSPPKESLNLSLDNVLNVVHTESNSNKNAIPDMPNTVNDVEETIPTFVVTSQIHNASTEIIHLSGSHNIPDISALEYDSNRLNKSNDTTSNSTGVCEKLATDIQDEQHQLQENLSGELCNLSVDSNFCLPESDEAALEYDESNFEVANYVDIETTDSPRQIASPSKTPSKIYNCVFCSLPCSDEIFLLNHLTEAHAHDENLNKTLYKCGMCGCGFRSKEAMDQHVENKHSFCENEHNEGTQDFDDCESSSHNCKKEKSTVVTSPNFGLDEITDDAHIESQYVAEMPNMKSVVSKNEKSNKRSKKKKQSSKKRKCEICNMKFSAGLGLFNHNRMHHRETHIFKCDSCRRQFSKYDKYQDHDCKPMTRLFCKRCNIHFTTEESMLKHKTLNHNMGTFKCEYCYKYFKSNPNLIKHMKIKHSQHTSNDNLPSSSIKPPFSKRQYSIYEDLQKIYQAIEQPTEKSVKVNVPKLDAIKKKNISQSKLVSKHECNICNKQFNTNTDLVSHAAAHKQRYYKCLKCSKKFLEKSMLLKHIKNIHKILTNKIFKCEKCNAVFKFEDKLNQHYKLKHNEPSTENTNQSESFNTSIKETHEHTDSTFDITSTNVKQKDGMYICKDCGAYLPSSESLQRHMQWEHMKSHKCGHCGEVLPTAEEFLRHLMSGHANEKIKEVLPESSFKWKTQLAYKHERQGD